MFKKKLFLPVLVGLLVLIIGLVWFFNSKSDSALPTSTHFQLLEDPATLVYAQDISELSVTPEAVTVWQAKIKELELAVANITDDTEKSKYYNDLGMYHMYLGDYRQSYDYYIKSLDISYVNRITWLQFGDLLIKMKAFQSAEKAYWTGNDINPYEQLNYTKIADLYILLGKSEAEIIAVYDQGIAKIPQPSILYQAKAYYYEKNKNYAMALAVYEEWLKIASEESKANIQERLHSLKAKI